MLVDNLSKIATWLNARYIHKERLSTEMCGEISKQTPSLAFSVFPSITNKDCPHAFVLIWLGQLSFS